MRALVKFTLTLCFLAGALISKAQDVSFSFKYVQEELKAMEVSDDQLTEHYLGYEIAKKLQLLKESYTYEEPGNAVQPVGSTVVEKPSIYYSIKKIDRHYKKSLRKDLITENEARKQFNKILDIALNIRHQETTRFEEVLWDIKDPEEMASLYENKVTLDM